MDRVFDSTPQRWPGLMWLIVGVLAVIVIVGCRRGVPLATEPRPVQTAGTISGTVRGPERSGALDGRIVQVTNLETNEVQRVTTNNAGGFTVKVKPGKYRVELTLRSGESLVKQPAVMKVDRSDADAHADFIIGSAPASRPRSPASRMDAGLGSPIA